MDIFEYIILPLDENGRERLYRFGTIINSTGSAIHLNDKFIASIKALTS
jgi:hypothetical protein